MTPLEISVFLTILLSLIALATVIVLLGERIRNAIREGTESTKQQGLKTLEMERQKLALAAVQVTEDNYLGVLNQIVLDVTGAHPGIDQVLRTVDTPAPHIVALGGNFEEITFAPALDALVGSGEPRYEVSALTGGLFCIEELEAVYHLLSSNGVLPRTQKWYIAVKERAAAHERS
jgi:hypothetical protein